MRGQLFLGLVILTTTISIGCGGGSTANREVAAGDLVVSPSTLDFGQVEVGKVKHQIGTLTAGDSSITETSADRSGDGYSVGGIVFPLTVRAGQTVPFKITFSPSRTGRSGGKISFQSDAEHVARAAFQGKGTSSHFVTLACVPRRTRLSDITFTAGLHPRAPSQKSTQLCIPKPHSPTPGSRAGRPIFM